MNILNRVILEAKIGEEIISLFFRQNCPDAHLQIALTQMLNYVNDVIASREANQPPLVEGETPPETEVV